MDREEEKRKNPNRAKNLNGLTQRSGEETSRNRSGSSDPLCVSTEELAQVIDAWIEVFEKKHPWETRGWATVNGTEDLNGFSVGGVGPLNLLSKRIGKDPNVIRRIRQRKTRWTTLAIADLILTGMDLAHLLSDGTVRVVPNPAWSRVRWEAWSNLTGACDSDWEWVLESEGWFVGEGDSKTSRGGF